MLTDAVLDRIRVLTHSAIRIESEDGRVLYFDPFDLSEAPHDADYVLITHAHYDHYSPEDIAKVANPGTAVVCPAVMSDTVAELGAADVVALAPGERCDLVGISVEAVPAYNAAPERLGFHPRENQWVGYVVTVDGARIYVAGDTDDTPEACAVVCDAALLPVGGTYTTDAVQAAALAGAMKPAVAIPTHYGTAVGSPEDGRAFAHAVGDAVAVALKMETRA